MKRIRSARPLGIPLLALAALVSCEPSRLGAPHDDLRQVSSGRQVVIPAKGTATTLDFATYNIEWFGDAANGPTNETLQQSNVRDIISGADMDIWGFQEVVGASAFNSVESQLPGYTGFLANESLVVDGPAYYSDFSNTEQKVGILYKSSVATLVGAKIILKTNDYDFAGRPPMEVTLRVSLNGTTEDIIVIVLHNKCCTDDESYQRRLNASNALKSYIDTTHPTRKVWVIGDWNDDVDTSISIGRASPFKNFVDATTTFRFPTKALSDAGIASTVSYSDMIDHHLVTNESNATYVANSAEVYRVDAYITNYGTTTSDHYPVLSRYTFGGGGGGNTPPTAAFTSSCSSLSCSFTDGSTDSDGTVTAWSWNFGDGNTSTTRNPSHTYASGGTYTVSLTVTDNAGATGSTSQSVTVSAPASPISLSVRGYKVKGIPKADLTWSGATTASVDIFRNGVLVVTTANDGAHTDTLPKGSAGTFTYKVCEAGSAICSAGVSTTF